ncbi:MAG: carboxypeptidase-like regulatory domain-containing protein, partial [Bacteroidota bacterium]|nr:carboxypeptidase-like regulatory domain-containing protein [Bacteroidota bacterium]
MLFLLSYGTITSAPYTLDRKNASISGFVHDAETGETLVGASVRIKGKPVGTVTNKSGFYALNDIPPGECVLVFSFIGYRTVEEKVTLREGQAKRLDVLLKPEAVQGEEVVVEGNRTETERAMTIGHVNIPIRQIQQIRIGGEADVFRSIQYLPGVLASSQLSSGLYVRGGSPDQTLVLLDGSTVYNPSHLFGFFSTFNPDAIKDVDLIKGGYPAEYGGRLSAVLDLVQKDGNRNAFEGLASVGLISSRMSLEGPLGNGSWFLGGRRTYIDLVTGLLE